jgi:hypothetical protein
VRCVDAEPQHLLQERVNAVGADRDYRGGIEALGRVGQQVAEHGDEALVLGRVLGGEQLLALVYRNQRR